MLGNKTFKLIYFCSLSLLLFAVLGNVSAKWVSPALHVIDAKMDIMTLIRMAASPANAIIGLPVVMPSQVHTFLTFLYNESTVLFTLKSFIYELILPNSL